MQVMTTSQGLITFRVASRNFSINWNITDNIITHIINVERETSRTNNKVSSRNKCCLLLTKKQIWKFIRLWRRPTYQTMSKAFYISSGTTWVELGMLKALTIPLDSTIKSLMCNKKTWNHSEFHKKDLVSFDDQGFLKISLWDLP